MHENVKRVFSLISLKANLFGVQPNSRLVEHPRAIFAMATSYFITKMSSFYVKKFINILENLSRHDLSNLSTNLSLLSQWKSHDIELPVNAKGASSIQHSNPIKSINIDLKQSRISSRGQIICGKQEFVLSINKETFLRRPHPHTAGKAGKGKMFEMTFFAFNLSRHGGRRLMDKIFSRWWRRNESSTEVCDVSTLQHPGSWLHNHFSSISRECLSGRFRFYCFARIAWKRNLFHHSKLFWFFCRVGIARSSVGSSVQLCDCLNVEIRRNMS